jgi:hypothetical protein
MSAPTPEPTPNAGPQLSADEWGIWRERTRDRRSGIEWGEVYRVSVHKLNGITEFYTCVGLDFEFGDCIELYENWPGFAAVTAAITERLPGISPDWLQRVERLGITDPPIDVWRRP